eukprot:11192512-Lingulodinium_polyedra.AAC.1
MRARSPGIANCGRAIWFFYDPRPGAMRRALRQARGLAERGISGAEEVPRVLRRCAYCAREAHGQEYARDGHI